MQLPTCAAGYARGEKTALVLEFHLAACFGRANITEQVDDMYRAQEKCYFLISTAFHFFCFVWFFHFNANIHMNPGASLNGRTEWGICRPELTSSTGKLETAV